MLDFISVGLIAAGGVLAAICGRNARLATVSGMTFLIAGVLLSGVELATELQAWTGKIAMNWFLVPVLVLAQLNREVDKNTSANARPKLANLRDSGAIEQDADIVTFLHRNRDEAKNLPDGASVDAELIVEKNRNGKIGTVKMLFYPSRMEFVPAAPVSSEFDPKKEN